MAGKPKQTAAERLAVTRVEVAQAKAELDARLRADEAEARAEARALHNKHLWALARMCDAVGLGSIDLAVLEPHLKALAGELEQLGVAGADVGRKAREDQGTQAECSTGVPHLGTQ